MNPKCTLPEGERAEILSRFPAYLSAEQEDTLRTMFPQYLFFYFTERMAYEPETNRGEARSVRVCRVTCCRESYEALRVNGARGRVHNENVTCPYCGKTLTGKAVYKHRYDMHSLTSRVKAVVAWSTADGALWIEAGNATRGFTWDELDGVIDWEPTRRYYFRPGAAMAWTRKIDQASGTVFKRGFKWTECRTVGEPFSPQGLGWVYRGEYEVIGLGDALARSGLRYSQLLEYYQAWRGADLADGKGRGMMKYLGWYTALPQMEMAVKFGFYGAVAELVESGKKNAALLDWKAKTAAGFLRMEKEDAKLFLKCGMDFNDLRHWKRIGEGMSLRRYIEVSDTIGGSHNIGAMRECAEAARVSFNEALRYMRKIGRAEAGETRSRLLRLWKDYLDMAEALGYDLGERSVALPRDLRARHDAAAETISAQKEELEQKKYQKRRKTLEKRYSYEAAGLRIIVPGSAEEIVLEGKTLHHCGGGYAARHISGTTTILFLRRARRPERSFLTIEIYEDRGRVCIRQIHGYKNEGYGNKRGRSKEEEYAWFLGPWLDWINSGSKRDKNGKPVTGEKKGEKTA